MMKLFVFSVFMTCTQAMQRTPARGAAPATHVARQSLPTAIARLPESRSPLRRRNPVPGVFFDQVAKEIADAIKANSLESHHRNKTQGYQDWLKLAETCKLNIVRDWAAQMTTMEKAFNFLTQSLREHEDLHPVAAKSIIKDLVESYFCIDKSVEFTIRVAQTHGPMLCIAVDTLLKQYKPSSAIAQTLKGYKTSIVKSNVKNEDWCSVYDRRIKSITKMIYFKSRSEEARKSIMLEVKEFIDYVDTGSKAMTQGLHLVQNPIMEQQEQLLRSMAELKLNAAEECTETISNGNSIAVSQTNHITEEKSVDVQEEEPDSSGFEGWHIDARNGVSVHENNRLSVEDLLADVQKHFNNYEIYAVYAVIKGYKNNVKITTKKYNALYNKIQDRLNDDVWPVRMLSEGTKKLIRELIKLVDEAEGKCN